MDKPPLVDEKTREEVEAERKAKRAAKQERKKAALEKQKADEPGNQQKCRNQTSDSSKGHKASEPVKEIIPKSVSIFKTNIIPLIYFIISLDGYFNCCLPKY